MKSAKKTMIGRIAIIHSIVFVLWFFAPTRWPPSLDNATGILLFVAMPFWVLGTLQAMAEGKLGVVLHGWIYLPGVISPLVAVLLWQAKRISPLLCIFCLLCVALQIGSLLWMMTDVMRMPASMRLSTTPTPDVSYWIKCFSIQVPYFGCASVLVVLLLGFFRREVLVPPDQE